MQKHRTHVYLYYILNEQKQIYLLLIIFAELGTEVFINVFIPLIFIFMHFKLVWIFRIMKISLN